MTFAELREWVQFVGGLMVFGLYGWLFLGALWVTIRRAPSRPPAPTGPSPADAPPVRNYADVKHEPRERGDEDPSPYRAMTVQQEAERISQLETQLEIARFDYARRVGLPYKTSHDALTEPPPRVVRPKRAWIKRKRDGMQLVDEASEALFRDVMGYDHSGP